MMNAYSNLGNPVLGDSEKGGAIRGVAEGVLSAKEAETVAAIIHLDHLKRDDLQEILQVLKPYDSNMKVETKTTLNPGVGIGSMGLGLQSAAEMPPLRKDLSLDASAEVPAVSINGQSGKLDPFSRMGNQISGSINGDRPSLGAPSADVGAKVRIPSAGLDRGLDGAVKAPNLSVSPPKVDPPKMKMGNVGYTAPKFSMPSFNVPEVKLPKPDLDASGDIALPSTSGSLAAPKFSLPDPKIGLNSENLDLDLPNVGLNGPDGNLEIPNAGIEASSGKFKWFHEKPNLKLPKINASSAKADLSLPDTSLSAPTIEGHVTPPDANISLPESNISGPGLDVNSPDLEIDHHSARPNWLNFRMKKDKWNAPKADLNLDGNLNTPEVSIPKVEGGISARNPDLHLPRADIKGPNVGIQSTDMDVEAPSGKINWPHLKWKKRKGPKADVDLDTNAHNLNLSAPNIETDLHAPKAKLADLPSVDVKAEGVEVPSAKTHRPNFKFKKPKVDGSPLHLNLNADADANVSVPTIEGDLSSPDIDGDIDAHFGKSRFPTFKKPKLHLFGPKVKPPVLNAEVKAPEVSVATPDASLNTPNVDLNLPHHDLDVKAPTVDMEPTTGKFSFKKPNFKKFPRRSLSAPKVTGPDLAVSAPDVDLSAPTIDSGITVPDASLDLPKANLQGPNIGIDAPDVEGPSGKFKWFHLKKPTLNGPKADINAKLPDVDAPNVNMSTANVDFSAPKINGELKNPDLNIALPKADVSVPTVEADSPSGKLKFPKFKLKKHKAPKVDVPELDAEFKRSMEENVNFSAPTPNVEVNLPNAGINGPKVDLPDADVGVLGGIFKAPTFNLPDLNVSKPKISGPNLKADAGLGSPGLDLSVPPVRGGLSAPALDAGLQADPKAEFSLPTIPSPNIKGTDLDLNLPKVDVNGANLDLPKGDLNVNAPKFTTPGAKVKTSDLGLDSNVGEFKLPNFPLPGLSSPSVNPSIHAPNVNIENPTADAKISVPTVTRPDVGAPKLDASFEKPKLPHYKLPSLGFSEPDVEIPSVNPSFEAGIKAPNASVGKPIAGANFSIPNVAGDIDGPKIDVHTPKLDANLENPEVKLPKMNLSGPAIRTPEVGPSGSLGFSPGVKVNAPSVEAGISSPEVSPSAPAVKTNWPQIDVTAGADAEDRSSPKNKMKWPFKWGFKSSTGTEEGTGVESETDPSNTDMVPSFKYHNLPRGGINGSGGIGDIFSSAKIDTEAKDYVVSKGVRLPVLNPTSNKGEKIDIMERLRMAKERSASGSPTSQGVPGTSTSDENDKMSVSLSNMLVL